MDMSILKDNLMLIVPLIIVQLILLVSALVHIFTHKKYRKGNRAIWVLVAILINTLGPILYFVLGSDSGESNDDFEE